MEDLEFIDRELEGAGIKIGQIVQAQFDSSGTVNPSILIEEAAIRSSPVGISSAVAMRAGALNK
jgi:hypothetical protein